MAFLSEAVSDSIAGHEKGLRTIDTSELCTNELASQLESDRMIEDSQVNTGKFYWRMYLCDPSTRSAMMKFPASIELPK